MPRVLASATQAAVEALVFTAVWALWIGVLTGVLNAADVTMPRGPVPGTLWAAVLLAPPVAVLLWRHAQRRELAEQLRRALVMTSGGRVLPVGPVTEGRALVFGDGSEQLVKSEWEYLHAHVFPALAWKEPTFRGQRLVARGRLCDVMCFSDGPAGPPREFVFQIRGRIGA